MSTTIRQAVHEIVKEHNAITTTVGSLKLAIEKFQADPSSQERKEFILGGLKEIRDAAFRANALIQEIKFPTYSMTDPDVDIEELYDKLREKNKEITVHVVEDEEGQCLVYKKTLEKAGFLVSFSHNYTDAVEHIVKETPYIVILDLHIPKSEGFFGGMYGHELMEIINKESKGTQTIVITGERNEKIIEHLKQFNPVRILTKPVLMTDVEAALTAAVAKIVR